MVREADVPRLRKLVQTELGQRLQQVTNGLESSQVGGGTFATLGAARPASPIP